MTAPLNILFVTHRQWRAVLVGRRLQPHLDALAASYRFARHFANTAPCGPSRTTLHTGLYLQNHRSGTNGTPLDARHVNWAKISAGRGYDPVFDPPDTMPIRDPAADDPWLFTYEGWLPGIRPVAPLDGRPQAWVDWLRAKGVATPGDAGEAYGWRAPGPDWEDGAAHPRPLAVPAGLDDTQYLVQAAMDYMAGAKTPFIAHLSLLRPHPPWVAPEPYNALYDPDAVPGFVRRSNRQEEGRQHPWLAWRTQQPGYRPPADENRLRRLKAVYYGLMSRVDDALGELIGFLRRTGLIERTLILFTSDHGEEMGDHWLLGKGGYFDGSYHVPLIVRDPRASADAGRGRVVSRFTEHVDVLPTMLAAIGADIPFQADGADLAPFLDGRPAPADWRNEAHIEFDFRDVASGRVEADLGLRLDQCGLNVIRGERYKYVHFAGLPPLFFDLHADPGEFENRADDPAFAPLVLAYAQKLISWRMEHEEHGLDHMALTRKGLVTRA